MTSVQNYDVRQYQAEAIPLFEDKISRFLTTAVGSYSGERQISGSTAQILVAGAGLDTTGKTRDSRTGEYVYDTPQRDPITVTLKEIYSAKLNTTYDVFSSQADTRRIFLDATMAELNRSIDDIAIDELSNATLTNGGAGQPMTLSLALDTRNELANARIPVEDGNVFAALCPRAMSDLLQVKEFASIDYVDYKPFSGMPSIPVRKWMGINWFESTRLNGLGTASATNFMWHRNSIAMVHNGSPMLKAGTDDKHNQFYYNASLYIGAKILQNTGIRKITTQG